MDRERILYEGILAGLAGAAAVAVWFFLYNLAAATLFRTPALLGAVLFEGLRDTATLTIAPGIVLNTRQSTGWSFSSSGWRPRACSRLPNVIGTCCSACS